MQQRQPLDHRLVVWREWAVHAPRVSEIGELQDTVLVDEHGGGPQVDDEHSVRVHVV